MSEPVIHSDRSDHPQHRSSRAPPCANVSAQPSVEWLVGMVCRYPMISTGPT